MTDPLGSSPGTGDSIAERVLAFQAITQTLRAERFAFLGIMLLSLVLLLTCAVILFLRGKELWAIGMFGSSGVITLAARELLRTWSRAMDLVLRQENQP